MQVDSMEGVDPKDLAVLSTGATAAVLTSSVTSTVNTVAAAATASATEAQRQATDAVVNKDQQLQLMDEDFEMDDIQRLHPQASVAWDMHLERPNGDQEMSRMMQVAYRASMGLTSDTVEAFTQSCEFISLGCFCAVSHAFQLLGLKKNSYPFDWVRSPMEGIMHCLDSQFQDFLTYSTYMMQQQYVVFGGTRWGGSFWHHNLEAPTTRDDMVRRIERLYGCGNVPADTPRFFARCCNSSREVLAALRLRDALRQALPEAKQIYLLIILDLQDTSGPMAVAGEQCEGVLFYTITEAETQHAMAQGSNSFRLCSELYARAVACAVRFWSGEVPSEHVRSFPSLRLLEAACVQFDGGDPARDLFTPRKFYGQQLLVGQKAPNATAEDLPKLQSLVAATQIQMFVLPGHIDVAAPFQLECFGKRLKVSLPSGTASGHCLHLALTGGVISASVSQTVDGQVVPVGTATVEEI